MPGSTSKVNKRHTLVGRFSFWQSKQDLQGVGGFSLPSRAYSGDRSQYTIQVTETALLNEKTVNETRMQLSRNRFDQLSVSNLAALNVQDAVLWRWVASRRGGESTAQVEIQNFMSWSKGKHFSKSADDCAGWESTAFHQETSAALTLSRADLVPALDNNNQIIPGQFIQVGSLERYRRTLLFQRQGLSANLIRTLGGGATQLSIAGGDPEAKVTQADAAFYFQTSGA